MDIDFDRVTRNPYAAGALGSLVALRFAPGLSWLERFVNVATGGLCAGFLAPGLSDWWHITSHGIQSGLAFGVGMFGLSLAAAVLQGIRELRMAEIITGWISRKG